MSTSIHELIEASEKRANGLRYALERFPMLSVGVLWDDGPLVPYIVGDEAQKVADRVALVTSNKVPALIPFAEVGPGRADLMVRVYCLGDGMWDRCSDLSLLLYRMTPMGHAALLKQIWRNR